MEHQSLFPTKAVDRFWAKVRQAENGCWYWNGYLNSKMYGRVRIGDAHHYVHRVSKMIELGRMLRPDEIVMHKCNNPNCVNPAHLDIGSILINNDHRNRCGHYSLSYIRRKKRMSRLKPEQVAQVKLRLQLQHGVAAIAADLGVHWQTIADIRSGKTWRNIDIVTHKPTTYDPFADG